MERRLCHFGLEDGPHTLVVTEAPDVHAEIVEKYKKLTDTLGEDVGRPAVTGILRKSPVQLRMEREKAIADVPNRLNEQMNAQKPAMTELRGRLLPALSHFPDQRTNVEEMIRDVSGSLPADAARRGIKNRYVRMRAGNDKRPDAYEVNFLQIEKDRETLTKLQQLIPAQAADFEELKQALSNLERQDPRLPEAAFVREHSKNIADSTIKHVGGMAVALIAIVAAIGTTAMALKNKKSFTAPLLYAAVAGLLISPDLRRQLFGGKKESTLAQLDTAINNDGFKKNSREYGVQGPAWTSCAERIMRDPSDTKAFLREIQKLHPDSPEAEKTIDRYVRGAMPADAEARASLTKMIKDGRYKGFAESLMYARDPDAQSVVRDYIRQGSAQYERVAEASAENAEKAYNDIRHPFPAGGYLGLENLH